MIAVQTSPAGARPACRRKRAGLGKAASTGIAISVALHAGALTYLALRKFVMAPPQVEEPRDVFDAPMFEFPKPEPKPEPRTETPPPAATVKPRLPDVPRDAPPVEAAPFAADPTPVPATDGPPLLTPEPRPEPPLVVAVAPTPPTPRVIGRPDWLKRPGSEQLARHYPTRALADETPGRATLDCFVTAGGRLTDCRILSETPAGQGFGEAGMKLARYFQMSPRTEDGLPVDGGQVRIPIAFNIGD